VSHDLGGRIVGRQGQELRYDARNRLVAVLEDDIVVEAYAWSDDGRMAARYDHTGLVERYGYDGVQMVAAVDADNHPTWDAVWADGIDQLVQWTDRRPDTARTLNPVVDHRNAIVAMFDAAVGTMTELAAYDADGRVKLMNAAEKVVCDEAEGQDVCPLPGDVPFGFGSAWRSAKTGLVWMRNRWYDPGLGQFVSQDPVGAVDSFNLYGFVGVSWVNAWNLCRLQDHGDSIASAPA